MNKLIAILLHFKRRQLGPSFLDFNLIFVLSIIFVFLKGALKASFIGHESKIQLILFNSGFKILNYALKLICSNLILNYIFMLYYNKV